MGAARSLPSVAPASGFDACIPVILAAEGGFVNDPRDPGGATNRGITARTLAAWRHGPVSKDDVRQLGEGEARAIYRANYWNPLRADELPRGVDLVVFDFGVNAGPARAARLLQMAIGAFPDGAIGPATLARLRSVNDIEALIRRLGALREGYYRSLDTFRHFGPGWLKRVGEITRRALAMAR
jgi:lysozyme family protein